MGNESVAQVRSAAGYHPSVMVPFNGALQAERIDSAPIPKPKTRRETRYRNGRWQTLGRKGWE